jgi:cytochrome c551/c552
VIGIEHVYQARIKHVYQGVQGACPQQAVTSAGGTAERQQALCRRHGSKACHYYFIPSLG